MISMEWPQQTTVIGLVLLFSIGCSTLAMPFSISTSAPNIPTRTLTGTMNIYKSDDLDVTFEYPNGWYVKSDVKGTIDIVTKEFVMPMQRDYAKDEIAMGISGVPTEFHAANSNAAIATLDLYVQLLGVDKPDKEQAHIVTLDGRKFIIGTYSKNLIRKTSGLAPLFIAVYFTEQNTLIVDLYAQSNEETRLRTLFEDFLVSIKDIS